MRSPLLVVVVVVMMMVWRGTPTTACIEDSFADVVDRLTYIHSLDTGNTDEIEGLNDLLAVLASEGVKSLRSKLTQDKEGYYLAFRVTAHIQKNVYERYTQVGKNDDDEDDWELVPCGCKGSNGTKYCDRHYRSVLLDMWPRLPVEKVKVAVFNKGEEKMRVIFDGRNSDYLSFFRQNRVLESPYVDLKTQSTNYFSVEGHPYTFHAQRRFFMNHRYAGCADDFGWLTVVDATKKPTCDWEVADSYPNILYMSGNTNGNWLSKNKGVGDVLTVSIKLRTECTAGGDQVQN